MTTPKTITNDFKKCTQQSFLSDIEETNKNNGRFCFILGSGASIESGIKTGREMQKEWLGKIKEDAIASKKDAKSFIEDKIVEGQLDCRDVNNDDELLRDGVVYRFKYTQELSWNVMKDYAIYQGYPNIAGSRDAIRQAFSMGIIDDKSWMDTIADRNRTSHLYNENIAYEIIVAIIKVYYPLFCAFEKKMTEILNASTSTELA